MPDAGTIRSGLNVCFLDRNPIKARNAFAPASRAEPSVRNFANSRLVM
jgi:hypothetical protein